MKNVLKTTLYLFFVTFIILTFTFFGNNIGMWRINSSGALVEKKYGEKMETWRLQNSPGAKSYIAIRPARLREMREPPDILNTKVVIDYYKAEVWGTKKDELIVKETLVEEFIFFVNPIFNEVTPSPHTKKTLKEY